MKHKVHLYTRFERLWHWVQCLLIVLLIITGFELHGSFALLGFELAHRCHGYCGWSLVVLTVFAVFWHVTTGEWKQYIPRGSAMPLYLKYYLLDIFKGLPHPFVKTKQAKLNPLQQMTYFILKALLLPLSIISGVLYVYPDRAAVALHASLQTIALLHTAGAFALLCFYIAHTYMTTTGGTLLRYITAMITGWENVENASEKQIVASEDPL